MIKAVYDPAANALTISGHAGYAPQGQDIVCAGVSALIYALLGALSGSEGLCFRDEGGVMRIRAPKAKYAELSMAVCGLEQLARAYPGYVDLITTDTQGGNL